MPFVAVAAKHTGWPRAAKGKRCLTCSSRAYRRMDTSALRLTYADVTQNKHTKSEYDKHPNTISCLCVVQDKKGAFPLPECPLLNQHIYIMHLVKFFLTAFCNLNLFSLFSGSLRWFEMYFSYFRCLFSYGCSFF